MLRHSSTLFAKYQQLKFSQAQLSVSVAQNRVYSSRALCTFCSTFAFGHFVACPIFHCAQSSNSQLTKTSLIIF